MQDQIRFDNFQIDVLAEGDAALELAVQLAMFGTKAITHWVVLRGFEGRGKYYPEDAEFRADTAGYLTLVLLDGPGHPEAHPLPMPMTGDTLMAFVADWLKSLQRGDMPAPMDHDGSNHQGFRIFTTGWGHVYDISRSVFGVQAAWAAYGK